MSQGVTDVTKLNNNQMIPEFCDLIGFTYEMYVAGVMISDLLDIIKQSFIFDIQLNSWKQKFHCKIQDPYLLKMVINKNKLYIKKKNKKK